MRNRYVKIVAAAVALAAECASAKVALDVDFVKGLLSIPSESRNIPECNRATAYLREYLEKRGVYCHVERTEEGRDALFASTVPGRECQCGFITHIDVVPALEPKQFTPEIVGDDIYARGACDTKINAAVIAQTLVELRDRASVGCYFATDEDGCAGKVPTCTMLLDAGYTPTKFLVVGDTSGGCTNAVCISQKGHWGFKLVTRGVEGHSSIPWKLDNAIPKLTRAVERIMAAYPMPSGDGSWRSTLAPTVLKAGEASNSIPGEAEVTFSFRYVGRNDVRELTDLIRRETGLEPETLYCVPPVVNDPTNPEIVEFRRAMDAFWPAEPSFIRDGNGATDAFQFSHLDLPCVIVSHKGLNGHKLRESGNLRSAEEYLNFFVGYFVKYREGIDWERAETVQRGAKLVKLEFTEPRLMKAYVMRVDLKTPGLRFTGTHRDADWGKPMPDYTNRVETIRTRRMTTAAFMKAERAAGRDMIAAFNSSGWRPWCPPWNHKYGNPGRTLISDGVVVSDEDTARRRDLFVAWDDGTCEIRDGIPKERYARAQVACCGFDILMTNDVVLACVEKAKTLHPRTAYGLSKDGRWFFVVAVDGRQPGWSLGADYADLVRMMKLAGASEAINMDGGGSTTMLYWDGEKPVPVNRHNAERTAWRANGCNLGIYLDAGGR